MRTLVYDDQGAAWPAQSRTLRIELGCPTADFDFLSYLVDKLGFILVQPLTGGAVRIRFTPVAVSPVALAAALFDLADSRPERIVLSYPGAECDAELVAGPGPAAERIAQLVASRNAAGNQPFINQHLPVETLAPLGGPLAALLHYWRARAGICDRRAMTRAMGGALGGRFVSARPANGRVTFVEVGPGFVSFDAGWRKRAAGRPVADQPDYKYGQCVQRLFEETLTSGTPRLDAVDAFIQRPRYGDAVRLRYRRLVLPCWDEPSQSPWLFSASILDDAIDFRSACS